MTTKRKSLFFKFPAIRRPRMTDINEFLREFWYVQYRLHRGHRRLNMAEANVSRTLRVPWQPCVTLQSASSGGTFKTHIDLLAVLFVLLVFDGEHTSSRTCLLRYRCRVLEHIARGTYVRPYRETRPTYRIPREKGEDSAPGQVPARAVHRLPWRERRDGVWRK